MLPFAALLLATSLAEAPAPAPRVLTLDQALSTADARQPELMQAQETAKASQARAFETRSGLLPQVNGRASFQQSWQHPGQHGVSVGTGTGGTVFTGGAGGVTGTTGTSAWNFGLGFSQLIWDFQSLDRYRASIRSAEGSELTAQQRLVDTRLGVRTSYFTARAQKALLRVARETLDNESRHLAQVKAFVQVGTHPEIDLAQERTAVANDQFQLIQAENNYAEGKAALNQAIGVEQGLDYDVEDVSLAPIAEEDQSVDALLPVALASRPDWAALERDLEAQRLTVIATRGGYWPSLSASAGLSSDGPELQHLGWGASVGLNLSWAVFSGLSTHYAVEEQEHAYNALQAQQAALKLQLRFQLEQALLAVRAAKAGLSSSAEALANAQERLRLAEGRYQQGVGSIIELGDAQVALTNAEAQRIQAEYNLSTARAQLLDRLGRL